jgi:hypothetical protein
MTKSLATADDEKKPLVDGIAILLPLVGVSLISKSVL